MRSTMYASAFAATFAATLAFAPIASASPAVGLAVAASGSSSTVSAGCPATITATLTGAGAQAAGIVYLEVDGAPLDNKPTAGDGSVTFGWTPAAKAQYTLKARVERTAGGVTVSSPLVVDVTTTGLNLGIACIPSPF